MDEFNRRLALVGLEDMFNKSFFSICSVDDAAKVLGVHVQGNADYQALYAIHCVKWGSMDRQTQVMVKRKVCDLLSIEWEPPKPEPLRATPAMMEHVQVLPAPETKPTFLGLVKHIREYVKA